MKYRSLTVKLVAFSLLSLFLALKFPGTLLAQESDLNLWSSLAIKYDWSAKTRLVLSEEFRIQDNLSRLEQNNTEIGLNQELSKRWEGGLYYRFIYETDPKRSYSLGHRAWIQLEYLLIDQDLELSIRTRLQTTFTDYYSSADGRIPEWYNRNKISCSYKPKKANWIPGAGFEFWYGVGGNAKRFLDKYRANIGLEYRQNKHLRWEVSYSLQQQLQVANRATDHILGINCTYLIN